MYLGTRLSNQYNKKFLLFFSEISTWELRKMGSTLELYAFSSAGYKSETLRVYKRCLEFPLNCNFMVHSDLCFRKFWWRHRNQTSAHSQTERGWIRARSCHWLIFSASSRIVVETCFLLPKTQPRFASFVFVGGHSTPDRILASLLTL